ncbi:MAG: UDP-2,3-diacylglucosamine diphosphatase LpxI, partial [Candidatus Omnitrophota bacterium]
MKIGLIAGNRLLPILLAQRIKEKNKNCEVIALCFKGETSKAISRYVDKTYWIKAGRLGELKQILRRESLKQCVMAGQISPWRIFRRKNWDKELISLVESIQDFRPHTIFKEIISSIEKQGIEFLDSTFYLKQDLAGEGVMNSVPLAESLKKDIDFGLKIISGFVELDAGQSIVVKEGSVAAFESFEGTNKAIRRGCKFAGKGCIVLKFSKANQDLRFDVPVVGISTLKLLKNVGAKALVLEKDKVIILDKSKFMLLAKKWEIS